jgi:hypothetical protein
MPVLLLICFHMQEAAIGGCMMDLNIVSVYMCLMPVLLLTCLHVHCRVQEAAIGSCMMHPNIVSVYSISLRPSGLPTALAAKPAAAAGAGSSGGLLLLREDGTAVMGASELNAGGGPKASAASLELLPWEMQLVMEYCDQVLGWLIGIEGGGGAALWLGTAP